MYPYHSITSSAQKSDEYKIDTKINKQDSANMPIYIVARCFSCEMFQVIQKPKSKKFKCKNV